MVYFIRSVLVHVMTLYFVAACRMRHCYGCASATVEHCMTLIRALAINTGLRSIICGQVGTPPPPRATLVEKNPSQNMLGSWLWLGFVMYVRGFSQKRLCVFPGTHTLLLYANKQQQYSDVGVPGNRETTNTKDPSQELTTSRKWSRGKYQEPLT